MPPLLSLPWQGRRSGHLMAQKQMSNIARRETIQFWGSFLL